MELGEKMTLVNNILRRIANWIGHTLRINCLLHDAIEGQRMEVIGLRRKLTQLFDDLRNRRRYWELKVKVEEDRNNSLSMEHKKGILIILH